ncbi:MAG: 50S ribosomal protein L6 [Flavobacteriaceae bacterium]|jgi:large subunit ribosomal protein L6|tara:strand:+ start:1185 stop:1727 length:543 start_codon:yes stop_codon:yes gene_type:complete
MSRIGNSIINIPEGVTLEVNKNLITAKGKLGELSQKFDGVSFNITDTEASVKRNSESKDHKSKHGLYRSLLNNMVIGVSEGFVKELELVGVGYRANSSGQKLDLSLGFSHTIVMSLPSEIKVETINKKGQNPIIKLSSIDKQLLGHIAAKIRSFRKPEPYKGKGVKYVGEQIRRKAGKQA